MTEKKSELTVELKCDNSDFMAALDEVEKKVDLITEKLEKLGQLTGQSSIKEDC
jgi:hypothetical protein